ncbi:Mth938-like domain-containing protein [Breoghania sp.]|uniref:Mth938-like domain-containing protein n=1 Tax=Breoghania sp. TaxID=2065378 RepID=UPI002AA754BA|nr:Mth938-like domain-containing protein [Breoghania sp.]
MARRPSGILPGKAQGLVIREAHFPGRAPIDAYGDGGFRFADMSHRGSLLVLPSGIHGWDANAPGDMTTQAFAPVFEQSREIEILLIGTGNELVRIDEALRQKFREHGIMADSMATGAAVRTLNVLLAENRAVAAALIAVE